MTGLPLLNQNHSRHKIKPPQNDTAKVQVDRHDVFLPLTAKGMSGMQWGEEWRL